MRKIASLFTMLMLFTAFAFGQNRTITGTVTDEKGDALPGASVSIKGTRTGVSADNNGQFRILAKTGDILVVSGANLETTETTVGTGSTVTISVKRLVIVGTEVVITALGVARQPKELGYSISKVKAAELTQAKSVNLQSGLIGKVSGLNVQSVNNGVFQDTRLTLRGIRSLTGNNQPMLILDGVPIDLRFLSSINPNDIVDVTILKSASATAVYGPDGANGALIVTTKKGSRTRPLVSVSHTVQVERVSYMPELQSQFGSGSSVDALGYGVYDPIENQCYGDEFDGSLREIGRIGPDGSYYKVPYKALPHEKRRFFSTGLTNQTDLSFSTGDFYLSVQSVLIQGIVPKDVNRRMSVHAAGNKEYNRFKASYSVNYTKSNYEVSDGANFGNGRDYDPIWNLVNTPQQIPITRFKNWRTDYWSSPDGYFNDYYSNPYFMIDNFRKKGKNEDLFGNLELNFKATNWLTFTYRLAATVSSQTYKSTQAALQYGNYAKASGKAIAQTGDFASGVLDVSNTQSRVSSEFFASIRKKFGKFDLNVLLGQSFREDNSKNVNMSNTNLAFPALFNISGRRGDPAIGESDYKSRLERFFGKVSLNFNNWIFLEGTGSYDIDSRLAYFYNYDFENTNYFYPGASLSVLLSEAIPALKSSKLISYLKVRGAYTKTGNVNLGGGGNGAQRLENTYGLAFSFPFGSLSGYTSSNLLSLSKYKPEFVLNKEAGIEIGLLKNRINIEATVYSQDNSNQIVDVAYSAATGFTQAKLNAASFENKGIELDLRLTPLVKIRNVSIDFKANYTYQDNKVTKIVEGVSQLGIGNGSYVIVDKPAYTFQVTDYVRDDQGRVIVSSTTGLPTVDPSIKPFGRTMPVHLLGLNLSVNWKDFSFSAVGDYRGGNQIYLGGVGGVTGLGPSMDFSGISKRSAQNSRQPFIFPNSSYDSDPDPNVTKYVDNTNIYMSTSAYGFWSSSPNTGAGTNYLVSGAFWKIREMSLSYNMPAKWFGFTKNTIKGATFTLSGRNLFMFLPKSNEWTDPEFSTGTGGNGTVGNGNAIGVPGLLPPPTRIFGASLNIQL